MKVSVFKQKEYNVLKIKEKLEKSLTLLGVRDNLIRPSDKVLIKPNMVVGKHYSNHICTHPAVVRAVCEIVEDYGGKIIIGDSPGFGSFKTAFKKSRYSDFLNDFETVDFKDKAILKNENGVVYKQFKNIAKEFIEADKIINIPKLKTHGMMLLTFAVKNMFGSIIGLEKAKMHMKAGRSHDTFAKYLVELYYAINPDLNVIDAIYGMEGNGPVSGTPKEVGFIGVSEDGIALDTVCCEIVGFPYTELPTYIAAKELKYSQIKLGDIEILGDSINDLKIDDFKFNVKPEVVCKRLFSFLSKFLPNKPCVIHSKCVLCGVCKRICPAKVISIENKKIIINHKNCIRCFCCQEFCEYDAMIVKKPLLRKITGKIGKIFKKTR